MDRIKIHKGYKGIKNDLVFEIKNKKLMVFTGENGSGKTTILKKIYSDIKEKDINSIFFKTSFSNEESVISNNRSLNRHFRRKPSSYRYENLGYDDFIEDIQGEFRKFCRKNECDVENSLEMYTMIFVKDSILYKHRYNFLNSLIDFMSDKLLLVSNDKIKIKFGIPTSKQIKTVTIKELNSKKFKNKGKVTYEAVFQNSSIYQKSYILDEGIIQEVKEIRQKAIDKLILEKQGKSQIKNQNNFEKYIYDLINPTRSIESIIHTLSRRIEDDYRANKGKRTTNLWEKINQELGKYIKNGYFPYLLNNPTDYSNYEMTFHSLGKDEYIHFNALSSGQKVVFELICYYFICEWDDLIGKLKIIILDEFDANLNPSLAEMYLRVIREQFCEKGIKVILTTHSPSTVVEVNPEELYEVIIDNNNEQKINNAEDEKGKKNILEKLAPKFIYDDELWFMGYVKGTAQTIIFVEGKTDDEAFRNYCIKNNINNYKFIKCDSANNIEKAIQAFKIISFFKKSLQQKKVLALYDFDVAGIDSIIKLTKKGKDIHDLRLKKQPIIINLKESNNEDQYSIHAMVLIPDIESNVWTQYDQNNNRYRKQEMTKEGEVGIKRQIDAL